jgi:hypothetical protein
MKSAEKPNLETFVKVKNDVEKDDLQKSMESKRVRPIPENFPGLA